ncbi:hypothetical protein EJB05_32572, partial [Eragrostis curvula]
MAVGWQHWVVAERERRTRAIMGRALRGPTRGKFSPIPIDKARPISPPTRLVRAGRQCLTPRRPLRPRPRIDELAPGGGCEIRRSSPNARTSKSSSDPHLRRPRPTEATNQASSSSSTPVPAADRRWEGAAKGREGACAALRPCEAWRSTSSLSHSGLRSLPSF